jgi:hypothetical protein
VLSDEQARWSGGLLVLGGLSFAAFVLVHPFDQLAGAEAMQHPRWIPAHTLHFLGSLFSLFGLFGLYVRYLAASRWWGNAAFLLAFSGTAMFAGTGLITAYLWPMMAAHAPAMVAEDGAVFTDRLSTSVIAAPYALMVPGYVLIALIGARRRSMPTAAAALLGVGALLFAAPVDPLGPAPWVARLLGGLLFGGALAWLGYGLWREPAGEDERARETIAAPRI